MTYAIIETGGKQYKVTAGEKLLVEKLDAEGTFKFDKVLMVGSETQQTVGTPLVEGASVSAKIVAQVRGPKLVAFKKKRRKGFRNKKGHRQDLTQVLIENINF